MIKKLYNQRWRHKIGLPKQVFNFERVIGTWIAVSPDEILPEEYINLVVNNESLRIINDVPPNWTLIQLSKEYDEDDSLQERAIEKINLCSKEKTIKELEYTGEGYFWVVASKDLCFPKGYNKEILNQNPWIEKGDWSLVCMGKAETLAEYKEMKKYFIESLPKDINLVFLE